MRDLIEDDLLLELVCDLLNEGRSASFVARGSSMHPVIRDGDRIVIEPTEADELKPGEVALYLPELPDGGQGMVVHRFLGRNRTGHLLMRGDACPAVDPLVPPEWVVGRVTEVAGSRRLRRGEGWGRWLLGGSVALPRLLAAASWLASWIDGEAPTHLLPLTAGRLARQRWLLGIALGDEAAAERVEELEDGAGRLQLHPEEMSLLPLLLHSLREAGFASEGLLPLEARDVEHEAIWRSAQTEAALDWLAETLAGAGLELLLCKGASLAWELYPAPYCRPAADIDCLARDGDAERVVAALLAAGAALAEPEYPLSYYFRYKNEVALRLPGENWPVLELHWRGASTPWYNRCAQPARFFTTSRPGRFGEHLLVMEAEAEFVFGVAHLAKHMPAPSLLSIVDLALLAQKGLNWGEIEDWLETERLTLPGAVAARWLDVLRPGLLPPIFGSRLANRSRRTGRLERFIFYRPQSWRGRLAEAYCQPDWTRGLEFLRTLLWPSRRTLERMFPAARGEALWRLQLLRLQRKLRPLAPPPPSGQENVEHGPA